MKKVILSTLLVSAVAFTSCKKEEPKVETTTETTETTQPEMTTTTTESTNTAEDVHTSTEVVAVPKMSTPEAQKFVDEYAAFHKEQMEAIKSGDATRMQEYTKKANEWATKAQAQASKLTPADQKLWADYMTQVSQEMANAAHTK